MMWPPRVRLEVLKLAVIVPPLVVNVPCPILAPLSEKTTTVPVGLAAVVLPGAPTVSVAVKVSACPTTDGLTEELTTVAVLALLTVSVNAVEVLVLKLVSPW